jgi:hypothetical protein
MDTNARTAQRLIAGVGGVALIGSLFLPWATLAGADSSGWELWTMADVFFLIVGVVAICVAVTGGSYGVFRPDVSLIGASDLLAVIASILITWLVAFDFPHHATRQAGVWVALGAAITIACAVGDYSTLRGAPMFPRLGAGARSVR